jgi:small subunit ribosomal protein S17e
MGKVRTEMIKRISNELFDKYPKSFGIEFEANKQFLKEIGLDVSKKLRNRVAGYVTCLVRIDEAVEVEFEEEQTIIETS